MRVYSETNWGLMKWLRFIPNKLLGGITSFKGVYVVPAGTPKRDIVTDCDIVITNPETGNIFLFEGEAHPQGEGSEDVVILVRRVLNRSGGEVLAEREGVNILKLSPEDWVEFQNSQVAINHAGEIHVVPLTGIKDIKFLSSLLGEVGRR